MGLLRRLSWVVVDYVIIRDCVASSKYVSHDHVILCLTIKVEERIQGSINARFFGR